MNTELEELRQKYVGKLARVLPAGRNVTYHKGIVRGIRADPHICRGWIVEFEKRSGEDYFYPTYGFDNEEWVLELHPRHLE